MQGVVSIHRGGKTSNSSGLIITTLLEGSGEHVMPSQPHWISDKRGEEMHYIRMNDMVIMRRQLLHTVT